MQRETYPTPLDRDLHLKDVGSLLWEVTQLRQQIRKHRDAKGNDRCHENDTDLYKLLPEGLPEDYDAEMPDPCVFMSKCAEYLASQRKGSGVWVSVEFDSNLVKYAQVFLQWKHRGVDDLELRSAFHMLTLPQRQFVAKLGLYCEEAGALPKE